LIFHDTPMDNRYYTKPPEFGAANFVMDFQMDIIDANHENIVIQKGPNLDHLTKTDKKQIAEIIMEIWSETAHQKRLCIHPMTIRKLLCVFCSCFTVLLVGVIAVGESNIYFVQSLSDRMKMIIAIALGVVSVIVLLLILCGMVFVMKRRAKIRDKWRGEFVQRLCAELVYFEQQHPQLTFSVIYPIPIWSRHVAARHPAATPPLQRGMAVDDGRRLVSAIWCYLRVSEGPIVTSDREPIYASTQWNGRKESESSRITGVNSTFSLNVEDQNVTDKNKKLSKKGNVQTGKFPVIAKKMGYKQLT